MFIVFPQMFSIFSWRNNRYHSQVSSLKEDCVCIIAPVCQKVFCLEPIDQLRCKSAIRCGTRSDKESHRQNRRCTFFQFPYVSGKSSQGDPVRRIQNTPLINCRVSCALPPRIPLFTNGIRLDLLPCFVAYVVSMLFFPHYFCLPLTLRTIILHFFDDTIWFR